MNASRNASLRIAVADDDPDMRDILVRLIRRLGHEVCFVAESGVELLDGFKRGGIDLIVTDLDMPLLDGLAAAEELAVFGVPVILISGHAELKFMHLDREPVGAALRKPLDVESLERAISLAVPGGKRTR